MHILQISIIHICINVNSTFMYYDIICIYTQFKEVYFDDITQN